MISPEEKIYSPESKTPQNAKETVPTKFDYVEPEDLGWKKLNMKIIIGSTIIVSLIIIIGIVIVVEDNKNKSKSHREENT